MSQRIRFSVHRISLTCALLCTTIGCDQTTKLIARDALQVAVPLSYLNNSVRLEYARNPGAFLSIGADLPESARFWFFNVAVACFLAYLAWQLFSGRSQVRTLIGFTLILAGGIGNLIDRIVFGSVTDFLIVSIGSLRTGIFNFADLAIVAGVILLALPQIARYLYAARS